MPSWREDPLGALAQPSRHNSAIPFPWRSSRLPRAFPLLAGLALFCCAVLQLLGPATSGCFLNLFAFPLELGCGFALLRQGSVRRFGAMLTCATMGGVALYLTRVHLDGTDVTRCRWLGPIELPFAGHLVVIAVLFGIGGATFLYEESRANPICADVASVFE
jgi:hypothetical protein